ncbi:alpha-N-acetylglucosaminidase [Cloacibacterium sp. Arc13]|uniref:alpha-N-acetylglucosaminidase n=1 Tax=unclassified Cloacibacterium TaxID=2620870 RepID=UPI00352DC7C1
MAKLNALFFTFFSLFVLAQSSDVDAAKGLVQRIAPAYAKKIVFHQEKSKTSPDYYELEFKKGKLHISANNANAMAVGFNEYLRTYGHVSVSWYADNAVKVPAKMPVFKGKISNEARVPHRFFLNYCTFGYTMPWWKWHDWERFIDWMALNGVNLPLAITGQEKIWLNVWKQFGLSDEEIRSFFTGPAYLPWHRMANIDHWEGPLPMSWIDGQAELQKKILARARAFNMKPVLPAFAGHVPKALLKKYPNAKITSLGEWGNFSEEYQSYFLDSFDPLFLQIQEVFLKEQTKEFGTDHIYGIDPFNEVTPPSWEPEYLAKVSQHIYESLTHVDPKAKWLQMGWIFYYMQNKWTNERIKAYLQAVPQDQLMMLDYFCDHTEVWKRTDSFFGQPYIWSYLGNFGGNTTLHGNLKDADDKIEHVLQNGGKNLWGIGATLEGFGDNPVMYEFILDKVWQKGHSMKDFVKTYAKSRVGKENADAEKAWEILSEKIYVQNSDVGKGDLTHSKPVFEKAYNWTVNPDIAYDNRDLATAWKHLIAAEANTDEYRDDLTAVGKQVLGNYFYQVRDQFTQAYRQKDVAKMKKTGAEMLQIIHDIDELLASNPNYLVGKWIADARAMTDIEQEKAYYERDARKIISVWGEKGRDLNDYANRSVAGLMKDYYGGRWKIFIDEAILAVEQGRNADEKLILERVNQFSWDWSEAQNPYPSTPKGNTLEISKRLWEKYRLELDN